MFTVCSSAVVVLHFAIAKYTKVSNPRSCPPPLATLFPIMSHPTSPPSTTSHDPRTAWWHSSANECWYTPLPFYRSLESIFGSFYLDACANPESNKAPFYYRLPDRDSLKLPWHPYQRVFMNPPYGTAISTWMSRAWGQAMDTRTGCTVVSLVPGRIDTGWFFEWVWGKPCLLYPVSGRLKFDESSWQYQKRMEENEDRARKGKKPKEHNAAGFPSVVVVYHPLLPLFTDAPIIGAIKNTGHLIKPTGYEYLSHQTPRRTQINARQSLK